MDNDKLTAALLRMFAASQAGTSLTSALFERTRAAAAAALDENCGDAEFLAAIRALVREFARAGDDTPSLGDWRLPGIPSFHNHFHNTWAKTLPADENSSGAEDE